MLDIQIYKLHVVQTFSQSNDVAIFICYISLYYIPQYTLSPLSTFSLAATSFLPSSGLSVGVTCMGTEDTLGKRDII